MEKVSLKQLSLVVCWEFFFAPCNFTKSLIDIKLRNCIFLFHYVEFDHSDFGFNKEFGKGGFYEPLTSGPINETLNSVIYKIHAL